MQLPIYENNVRVGTLQVSVQGLYTVFAAKLPKGEGLSRLWLLGRDGASANLGLLEPGKNGRNFCRRLSRMACRALPNAPVGGVVLPVGEKPSRPEKMQAGESGRPQVVPTENARTNSKRQTPDSEFTWHRLSDGSLIDPVRRLLALPWAGEKLPAPARKIRVKGGEYLVFRY